MEKSKIFIYALIAFLVCGAISFGITKVVKNMNTGSSDSELYSDNGVNSGSSSAGDKNSNTKVDSISSTDPGISKQTEEISNSDKQSEIQEAIAKAEADAKAKVEAAAKAKAEAEKKQKEAEARAASNRQSYDELTAIINNRANSNYPRNISIRYTNLDTENEEAQTSIANIRNYIRTGIWKSVTVVGATYDNKTGKVTSITLQINR